MSLSIPLASSLIRGARRALDFDTNERYKGF